MPPKTKRLIVVTGPTGSGKTDYAIELAESRGCHIVGADSRQLYRGLSIGTAAPTAGQLAQVPHHMVGVLALEAQYSAARYEADVMRLLEELWQSHDEVILCGGSMMYVQAVVMGIDEQPDILPEVRAAVKATLEHDGIEALREELQRLDPEYYARVDLANPRRLVHAVEMCRQTGRPYSSFLTGQVKERTFATEWHILNPPRRELFDRINRRVDAMLAAGLEEEARGVYHLRHLNSLNTVGYKEMFDYFDGLIDLPTARERIARNTRVYAKKQLTWMKRYFPVPSGSDASSSSMTGGK